MPTFILALVFPVELGDLADPTDNLFVPKPEWYFMSLYGLLKFFPGKFEVVATAFIPAGGILVLFLVPFIDKRPEKRPGKRKDKSGPAFVQDPSRGGSV